MRTPRIGLGILILAAAVLTIEPFWTGRAASKGRAQEPATAGGGEAREIQVTAKKYKFDPAIIQVKQGEHVKLIITATDHDHGFECGAFHINQLLKKGKPTTIEFTADKPGTFPFRCSHFCGMGHMKMKGQIIVPASQ